jgi:hypothetical protein
VQERVKETPPDVAMSKLPWQDEVKATAPDKVESKLPDPEMANDVVPSPSEVKPPLARTVNETGPVWLEPPEQDSMKETVPDVEEPVDSKLLEQDNASEMLSEIGELVTVAEHREGDPTTTGLTQETEVDVPAKTDGSWSPTCAFAGLERKAPVRAKATSEKTTRAATLEAGMPHRMREDDISPRSAVSEFAI